MSVVKAVDVKGSLSLVTPNTSVERVSEEKASLTVNEKNVESKPEPTEQEKKEMLELEFAQELNVIKQQAWEQGHHEGKEIATHEVQEKLNLKLAELEELIKSWSEMIKQSSAVVSWKIDNEEGFYALLYQAITKLLRRELSDKTYTEDLVSTLISDYSEKKIKMLLVSPLHYKHLSELGIIDKLDDSLKITAEPEMLPGSFKLGLKNGFIEYDLESSLQEFKKNLFDLATEDKS